jgi:hypothetical protein
MYLYSSTIANQTDSPLEQQVFDRTKKAAHVGSVFTAIGTGARKIHEIIRDYSKADFIQSLFQNKQTTNFANFFKSNENLFSATKYLRIFSLFNSVPTYYKSIKRIVLKPKEKKIWNVLKAIGSVCSISTTFQDIISVTVKVSNAVIKAFAAIGAVQSAIDLVIDSRSWWKSRTQLNHFIESVNYNEKGIYNIDHYKKLKKFINTTGIAVLSKRLDVNSENFDKSISLKLREIKPINNEFTPAQEKKVRELMDLIKNRLEAKKNDYVAVIITDAANLIGNALIIASVTQPYMIAIWVAFTFSTLVIQYAVKTIKTYNFEHAMGMIHRDNNLSQQGVKDFFKWYFNLNKEPTPISKEVIDLSNKIKKDLYSPCFVN